jgi:hypothetical protein
MASSNLEKINALTNAQDKILEMEEQTRSLLNATVIQMQAQHTIENAKDTMLLISGVTHNLAEENMQLLQYLHDAKLYQTSHASATPLLSKREYSEVVHEADLQYHIHLSKQVRLLEFYVTRTAEMALMAIYDTVVVLHNTQAIIYKITPFPNKGRSGPVIVAEDIQYVAVIPSEKGFSYTNLTITEYEQCYKHDFCQVSNPLTLVQDRLSCAMGTFVRPDFWKNAEQTCHYKKFEGQLPVLYTAADGIYYFADQQFKVDTLCQNYTANDSIPQNEFTIQGSGKMHIKPGCIAYIQEPYRMVILPPTGQLAILNMSTFNEYDIIKTDKLAVQEATVLEHTVDLEINNFTIPAINATEIYIIRNQTGFIDIPLSLIHKVQQFFEGVWTELTNWSSPFSFIYWIALFLLAMAMLFVAHACITSCTWPRRGQYEITPTRP